MRGAQHRKQRELSRPRNDMKHSVRCSGEGRAVMFCEQFTDDSTDEAPVESPRHSETDTSKMVTCTNQECQVVLDVTVVLEDN